MCIQNQNSYINKQTNLNLFGPVFRCNYVSCARASFLYQVGATQHKLEFRGEYILNQLRRGDANTVQQDRNDIIIRCERV